MAPGSSKQHSERCIAILIGINEYRNGIPPLRNAVRDVQTIAQVLRDEHGYQDRLLLDEQATLPELRAMLARLPNELSADTRLVLYFAGHGIAEETEQDATGPQGFLIPQDAKRDDPSTFLPMAEVQTLLSKLPCKHLLLLLDCCFAGAFRWSQTRSLRTRPATLYRERYERYLRDSAWQVMASAAADERALDVVAGGKLGRRSADNDNSPFAAALCRGLRGAADLRVDGQPGDGIIVAHELHVYLENAFGQLELQLQRTIQKPLLWSLDGRDKGQFVFYTPGRKPALPSALALVEKNNPYQGLEPYAEDRADLFFGRSEVVEQLYDRVRAQPLTVVSGVSGSGKSSVVQAGLLSRLRKSSDWFALPLVRPGERPLALLANVCTALGAPEGADLSESVAPWCQQHPGMQLLLVIDQLEELVTMAVPSVDQERFWTLLFRALSKSNGQLHIVATLRSDFEPHFSEQLSPMSGTQVRFLVRPLSRLELRQVIEGPASERVLYFEPAALVDQLIDEVAEMPGALPLLSFTMSELYRAYVRSGRDDRCLTADDYRQLRGVAGALSQRADEIVASLAPAQQRTLWRMMLRMVSSAGGELTRRKLPFSELRFGDPDEDERNRAVLARLVDARILVVGRSPEGEAYAEPAHDMLILGWKQLWERIHSEREVLSLLHRLSVAAAEWAQDRRPAWRLWHDDPRLPHILAVVQADPFRLNVIEKEFLLATEGRRQELERELREAKLRLAQIYEEQGRQLLLEGKPFRAAVYLSAAYQEGGTGDCLRFLLRRACAWLEGHQVLAGHTDQVLSASYSPDGASLVTASQDGTARLWGSDTGELQRVLLGHVGAVTFAAFAPGGTKVVTAGQDGTTRTWDTRTGAQQGLLTLRGKVVPLASSHAVWAIAQQNERIQIWDVLRMESRAELGGEGGQLVAAAMSRDGKRVAVGYSDGVVQIWDIEDGTLLSTLRVSSRTISMIEMSEDGCQVATLGDGLLTQVWDVRDATLLCTLPSYYWYADSKRQGGLAFSPDASKLVTVTSADQTARIWEVGTGKLLSSLSVHTNAIDSVGFSMDGRQVVTAARDRTACVWEVASGHPVAILEGHTDRLHKAGFNPDGDRVVTAGSDGTAQVWKLASWGAIKTLSHRVRAAKLSPDKTRIVFVDWHRRTQVWSIAAGTVLLKLDDETGQISAADFSPDGLRVVTVSDAGAVKVWDAFSGSCLLTLRVKEAKSCHVCFSSDGTKLVTASPRGGAHLWDSQTGALVCSLHAAGDDVRAARFSPDGTRIVAIDKSSLVRLMRVEDGALLCTLKGHTEEVTTAAFSNDSRRVVTASKDRTIRIWNADSGVVMTILEGHERTPTAVGFDPLDARVVSASKDETARIWNAANGQVLAVLKGHVDQVLDAAFSRDGEWVMTVSLDGTAKIWDVGLETRSVAEITALVAHSAPFRLDQGRLLPTLNPEPLILSPHLASAEA